MRSSKSCVCSKQSIRHDGYNYTHPVIVLGLLQRGSEVKASAGNSSTLTDVYIPVKRSMEIVRSSLLPGTMRVKTTAMV